MNYFRDLSALHGLPLGTRAAKAAPAPAPAPEAAPPEPAAPTPGG